ncbi:hypothetical protein HO173_008427 [Letharia columbiana]|uniref:Ankyrin repeat protein n=1 Tax=Letharia columbiana TaxID=112416 RepID=A0A8H6FRQ4_9LECA|nr:uncharacterized protein HO173_008427 [Letharia columbiana]KAF6233495.1 hypothetical protein HO173_008427 [Letharia columbiana]
MLNNKLFRALAGSGCVWVLQVLSQHCGLAEVPKKWLDLARLHDTVDSYPGGSLDSYVRLTRFTDLKIDLVKELLAQGVEPDVPDGRGQTPLMHAAVLGNILTVQALLSADASPSSKDRQGRTPLFFAAFGGHYGIVEILLDLGVSIDLGDTKGDTPTTMATRRGHMRVFRLLERRRQI